MFFLHLQIFGYVFRPTTDFRFFFFYLFLVFGYIFPSNSGFSSMFSPNERFWGMSFSSVPDFRVCFPLPQVGEWETGIFFPYFEFSDAFSPAVPEFRCFFPRLRIFGCVFPHSPNCHVFYFPPTSDFRVFPPPPTSSEF